MADLCPSGKAATPVESAPIVSEGGRKLANAHLEAVITENGSLTITDKATQKTYRNLLVFEDVGISPMSTFSNNQKEIKQSYRRNFRIT